MSIADALLAAELIKGKGGDDKIQTYILKKLIKKLEGDPKKKDEDKKKDEGKKWTFEERMLLGIFLAACAPMVGAAYVSLFIHAFK
jgi:hypothetical protein